MTHLGLPETIAMCLFDLKGVLTKTAAVHEAAWRVRVDTFLRRRLGADFRRFDFHEYSEYVDGRPRADGVGSSLASRGVGAPEGLASDSAQQDTVHGLGRRKNELLLKKISSEGVEPYPTTLRYIDEVRRLGLRTGVVSSSANCPRSCGRQGRRTCSTGSSPRNGDCPENGTSTRFLPPRTVSVPRPRSRPSSKTRSRGIDAARAGRFGFTHRGRPGGSGDAMRAHGADVVVRNISELVDRE
ncbi:hypothetical protein [Streptomyces sp. NPDC059861]|uniref:hypothetical protein n=1 Tax=Streptomyces sp. NPDC059861 TaxID=3346974 RepID=UPI003662B40F